MRKRMLNKMMPQRKGGGGFPMMPFSPQQKIISVNDRFGNKGIKEQQGSTVIRYDTLPYDGRNEYRFFEGSGQRNFPLSNTGSDGNKLGVGSSMVVERTYISIITFATLPAKNIATLLPIAASGSIAQVALTDAEFFFEIANSQVIKNVPVMSWLPQFNKNSENETSTSFEFDTQVVIMPLLEFTATLRTNAPAVANTFIRLTIEGTGAIIAPRSTF